PALGRKRREVAPEGWFLTLISRGGAPLVPPILKFLPRVLGGEQPASNLFEACNRWPGKRPDLMIGPDIERKPPFREPIANQQRAEAANQRACHHVARIVRGNHHPADRNQDGVGPQQRSQAREQCPKCDQDTKRRSRMAGGKAGELMLPGKRLIGERAESGRTPASNLVLEDRLYDSRERNRKKQKPE